MGILFGRKSTEMGVIVGIGERLQAAAIIIVAIFLATNVPKLIVPEKYAVDEIITAIGRATK